MKILKSFICIIILGSSLLSQFSTKPKVGTTVFQFLKVVPNARAAGLSGSITTTINSSDAVFFNPAVLVNTSKFETNLSYLDYFIDVKLTSASVSYQLGNIGVIGAFMLLNNSGEIDVTEASSVVFDYDTGELTPGNTGETFSVGSQCFGLSYARKISTQFSFGLNVKYVREDLWKAKASGILYDGGILFDPQFKSLKLGIMLRNFGSEIKYVNKSYPLPQDLTIGISEILLGEGDPLISKSNKLDLTMMYNMSQTRDHSQQHHIGAELTVMGNFTLRCGYKIYFDEQNLTYGTGLRWKNFHFDYAFNKFGEYLPSIHHFSFGLSMN